MIARMMEVHMIVEGLFGGDSGGSCGGGGD